MIIGTYRVRVDGGLLRIDAVVAVGTKVADRGSVVRTLQLSDGFIPLGARHVAGDVNILAGVCVLDRVATSLGEGRRRESARQKAKETDEHVR